MANILFWNLNRNEFVDAIAQIFKEVNVDIAILAEDFTEPENTLNMLKEQVSPAFEYFSAINNRYNMYCRDRRFDLHEFYNDSRVSLRSLMLDGEGYILGIVHLIDKWNSDQNEQLVDSQNVSMTLKEEERKAGHSRTILIGDFNMNPFEPPMNKAHCFNAMMTRDCISNRVRTVRNESYPFFYNPMWKFFGDHPQQSPGTFYHTKSSQGHYGWNLLDQVLLRPDALPRYEDVRILTKAGDESLVTRKHRPRKKKFSDHLPILLTLK